MTWRIVDAGAGKPVVIPKDGHPVIINGVAKSGASFFTVVLTAELVRADEPVLFMCAHSEGVRSLRQELGLKKPAVVASSITDQVEASLESSRLVTLFNKDPNFILRSLGALKDWRDRIVVIKNAETILSPALWATVKTHQRLIVSGDIRGLNEPITYNQFKTVVAFSDWPMSAPYQRGDLPPYIGALQQGSHKQNLIVAET